MDDDTYRVSMEILAEAATQDVFTVNARRSLERLYSALVDDAPGRVSDALEVLIHDGYLEAGDDGHRFLSRLLKDWLVSPFPRPSHPPPEASLRTAEVVPMNQSLAGPIRKANPGTFQSDHEVIRQFVVRNRELDIVMEILRGNTRTSSCQHVLLVAPRGRGKTMLLARVAAELRVHEDLSRDLLPVRFMEESHEVFDMADFWLECLFHLARESAVRDPKLRSELRDTHRTLSAQGRQDELIEPRARTAVLDAVDRLGKKLVLMVENLQDLSGDVDERFGWKLREELQSQPQIMLLATATSRFQGLDDATQPLFELFRILRLDPLDTEECRRLWHVLSGDAVHAREIRPLQILTGGSPRLLVFVADFSRHRTVRQLMEQLVKLIDDHTEYFRSHLEGFAKTERRVYLATVDLWQPSTAGEIAARARLDIRTVSTMLGRLVHRGAVISEGDGKRRRYSASERLYGIYYKLRRERGRGSRGKQPHSLHGHVLQPSRASRHVRDPAHGSCSVPSNSRGERTTNRRSDA